MALSRTSLVTGPAKITHGDASFFSKDDFEVAIGKETLNIATSAHGKVAERAIETTVEASFVPEGRFNAAMVDGIWTPFANMVVGASVFGHYTGGAIVAGTDEPLIMSASDGEIHQIISAGITKLPDIVLSSTKTLLGSITFTGVRQIGKDWEDASSLYTIASGGSITDSTFDPLDIKVQPYTGDWGAIAGFTGFDTEDGWVVSFNLNVEPKRTDRTGVIDYRFKGIEVMAKCVPVGPSAAQILAALELQGGRPRGHDMSDGDYSDELTITGDDGVVYVTIPKAALKTAGYRFGPTVLRNREIGFVAARTFTGGAQQPLYTIAAS